MTAHAILSTVLAGGSSTVGTLRSHAPLVLRPVGPKALEPVIGTDRHAARVALASGGAGPIGGDDFTLDIDVGPGSTLLLSQVSSTLLLPGARGGRSQMRIRIRVGAGATLVWLPEPLIAAAHCHHRHRIEIGLGTGARLLMRDELVLGRYGEPPGRLSQHLRVTGPDGRSLFQQRLDLGPGVRGWTSPAAVGGRSCVGTVLALDLTGATAWPSARLLDEHAALLPLAGPGVMVSALADDTVHLRRMLDQGVRALGPPWSTEPAATDRQAGDRVAAGTV